MGRATWVVSNIHFDRLYKKMPEHLQLLYFQLLSHPNGNKAGYFQIDLDVHGILRKGKTEDELREELMSNTGLWFYDPKTDVVLIPTYLKYNKIGSSKTFVSFQHELEMVPNSELVLEFIYRVNEYTEGVGLDYLPANMLKYARTIWKNKKNLTLHEGIINKILFP